MTVYKKSFSYDIAEEMQKGLVDSAQKEADNEQLHIEMFKSLDRIAALADRYEQVGMVKEATLLTELLEAYAEGDAEKVKNLTETAFTEEPVETQPSEDLVIAPEDADAVQGMMTFDDEV